MTPMILSRNRVSYATGTEWIMWTLMLLFVGRCVRLKRASPLENSTTAERCNIIAAPDKVAVTAAIFVDITNFSERPELYQATLHFNACGNWLAALAPVWCKGP